MHCITNAVAQNFTANMLLAAGAVPSMTIAPKEVKALRARAPTRSWSTSAPSTPERQKAALAAIGVANKAGIPWVLDPVFIDRSAPRARFASRLVALKPRALRLNPAEFGALAAAKPDDAALARFARVRRTVVGLTGERDLVRDAVRLAASPTAIR